jgi:exodeoxyribonuclease V alpha subunit
MDDQRKLDLFDETEKYIKGTLIHSIYYNQETLYSVARLRVKDTNEKVDGDETIIVGQLPPLHQDEVYQFWGSFKEHPKYGKQYAVHRFRRELPSTKQGMIQYLSSDLFHGIGKKTAEKIIEQLGENAFEKILENQSIIYGVPNLPNEKAEIIYKTLLENQGLEKIMLTLGRFNIGPALSFKIFQAYREEAIKIIQTNPYQLVYDIEGIGFHRADEIGKTIGIGEQHPDRLRAGLLFILQECSMQEGHVFMDKEGIISKTVNLLFNKRDVELSNKVSHEILVLEEEGLLVIEEENIYLPSLYFAEKGLITSVQKIILQKEYEDNFPIGEFYKALGSLEDRLRIEYAETQKDAIRQALYSPFMILTGGPGTGKTTVIQGIVEIYAELHGLSLRPEDYNQENPFPVILVAPTGRAAKRLSESTGLPASTVHRLLGWNGGSGFEHDEENPITGKLLIIDEMSMVDIWLANQLFKSLPEHIQVIVVGDEDQLPSVGPGQVLRDLINSELIPTVQLKDIYRQSEGSSIIELAHSIKDGLLPNNIHDSKADRRFIQCNQSQVLSVVEQVCKNANQKGYTPKDIQVLAPMYRGSAGINELNKSLQQLFNPENQQRREIKLNDIVFRVGDKVLQLVNEPEKHVFNGDIGEIVSIIFARETTDKEDQIIISFEGNELVYNRQDLSQITHAYCCSIHKSQGSEFPIVVMPIVKGYYRMLKRNLIYTGITRSKNFLILCGEISAFKSAIETQDDVNRNSSLDIKLSRLSVENVSLYDEVESDE